MTKDKPSPFQDLIKKALPLALMAGVTASLFGDSSKIKQRRCKRCDTILKKGERHKLSYCVNVLRLALSKERQRLRDVQDIIAGRKIAVHESTLNFYKERLEQANKTKRKALAKTRKRSK